MRHYLIPLVIGLFLLSGCSSYSVYQSCREGRDCARYAMVSEGKASGLVSVVSGAGSTCKVTTFGDVKEWKVSYAGETCQAVLNHTGGESDEPGS